jgi:hypothetical protein
MSPRQKSLNPILIPIHPARPIGASATAWFANQRETSMHNNPPARPVVRVVRQPFVLGKLRLTR